MNILITGGTGFLGSHLARYLSGNNITVLARGIKTNYLSSDEKKAFNFIRCDIRDKKSLREALSAATDLVIHCAGKIDIQAGGAYLDSLIEINLTSTINLIETMIEKKIRNIVFCSSMTVYGLENSIPVKENGMLNPVSFYGFSKKWAEEAIVNYAKQGFINALIIRYPGLYGYPRGMGYIYNITRKLLKDENVNIDPKNLSFWEAINVEDASDITKRILEVWQWKKEYEFLNCSYGKETDFADTAFKIKKLTNSKSFIDVKRPLSYTRFFMDNSKAKELIGFNYDFEDGLKKFIEKYAEWAKA